MTKNEYDELMSIIVDLQRFALANKPAEFSTPPFLVITNQTTQTEIERHFCRSEEYRKNLNKERDNSNKTNVDSVEDTEPTQTTDGVLVTPKEINQMIIKMPGVSMNSKPRKDGRYQGYIIDKNGKTYVYGHTMNEVAKKLQMYIQHGTPKKKKAADKINGVPTTFTAFAMYYFENFRKKKVAELTYKIDVRRFNKNLAPYFKETPLKKITTLQCQKLLDGLTAQGKGKTADEVYGLMSIIFKIAIKHGVMLHNPLDIVYHVKHETEHGAALTKAEEETLKAALKGSTLLPAFMVMLYTGLRPNELATVKFDGKFVVAVNSKRKHKRIEYKKIPISKMLAPYIDGQTFENVNINHLREFIKTTLPGHKLYDLRTTFYSRCKECGISEHAIKEYVGHSLGAIGNAYTDLSDEFLLKEMEKFEY